MDGDYVRGLRAGLVGLGVRLGVGVGAGLGEGSKVRLDWIGLDWIGSDRSRKNE